MYEFHPKFLYSFVKMLIYLSLLLPLGFLWLWRLGASHRGGFSCCRAQVLGRTASIIAACGLRCPAACGIFPDQGSYLYWYPQSSSLGREDLLEKETAAHSSVLAWRIAWTESLAIVHRVTKSWTHLKQLSTHPGQPACLSAQVATSLLGS